ncbi:MAG: serine--tRNA ligase [Candidatus Yanofskybacteria bacterium]|nr:serine--tRNA ligase [Candidatus Yanofskybacteria bacterium]
MLDIKFIRENPDKVREAAQSKGVEVDIDKLLALDNRRRQVIQDLEALRAEQNQKSKGKIEESEREALKQLKEKIKDLGEQLESIEHDYEALMLNVPNVPTDDVPVGPDESGNQIVKTVGELPKFDFEPKDHIELGERLDLVNTKKAGEVVGARFTYLKNEAALLQFALAQLVFETVTNEDTLKKIIKKAGLDIPATPFIPVVPPVFIRPDVYQKMARLEPIEERYYIPTDDLYLIGSAEHTMGPLHMNEMLSEEELPKRYIGYSTAFRREAGSYGKDTQGILRLHQFDKLEMESFTFPEMGVQEQQLFVAIQEYLLQQLELPYQVVMICTGDMGKPDARQVDMEVFMPGQNKYRETHTADYMTDYQARRLNTRVKRANGETEMVHMNDATAFAIGRTIIAILENYQTKEGTVKVPKVLQKYVGLKEIK